jgi:hypothetical protein
MSVRKGATPVAATEAQEAAVDNVGDTHGGLHI